MLLLTMPQGKFTYLEKDADNKCFCRSDAQRSVRQKERKEQEMAQYSFNSEAMDEQGVDISMVNDNTFLILRILLDRE